MTIEAREPATTDQESEQQAVTPRRSMLRDLQEVFDRIDTEFFTRPIGVARGEWFPRLDVRRQNGDILIEAELPGLKKDDVKVEVTEEGLVISGEKRQVTETKDDNYYRSERSFGRFMRRISLPHGADAEQAEAKVEDGILRIRIPVKEPPEGRVIEVKGQG